MGGRGEPAHRCRHQAPARVIIKARYYDLPHLPVWRWRAAEEASLLHPAEDASISSDLWEPARPASCRPPSPLLPPALCPVGGPTDPGPAARGRERHPPLLQFPMLPDEWIIRRETSTGLLLSKLAKCQGSHQSQPQSGSSAWTATLQWPKAHKIPG